MVLRMGYQTEKVVVRFTLLVFYLGLPGAISTCDPACDIPAFRNTKLFDALRKVESNGNICKINGDTLGPYQISEQYYKDSGIGDFGKGWQYVWGKGSQSYSEMIIKSYVCKHRPNSTKELTPISVALIHKFGTVRQSSNESMNFRLQIMNLIKKDVILLNDSSSNICKPECSVGQCCEEGKCICLNAKTLEVKECKSVIIQGPSDVIYFPNQGPVELTCTVSEGSTGWRVNGGNTITLGDIRSGALTGHSVKGTNLVVNIPTNNTQYNCVSIQDAGNIVSDPAFLYITGVIIQGPSDIIYFPNQGPVELTCTISEGSTGWCMNSTDRIYTLSEIRNGRLTGHSVKGTNLVVNVPANNTQYNCVSIQDDGDTISDPAFLYIAAAPNQVPDVTVYAGNVTFDDHNVTLTLSWGTPFNNLDPIVNYTVSCSGDVTCPPNFTTTDNSTRNYTITNLTSLTDYTFSVVATNSIGSGEAGVVMITTPSLSSSVTDAQVIRITPENATNTTYSITVICTIHPNSRVDMCEMTATGNGQILTGAAPITNRVATVTFTGLKCEVTYSITAGGTLNGNLVGPRSSHRAIIAGPCPQTVTIIPTSIINTIPTIIPSKTPFIVRPPDICEFISTTYEVFEGDTVQLNLTLTKKSSENVNIALQYHSINNLRNDIVPLPVTVSLVAGDTYVVIDIKTLLDRILENNESLTISAYPPSDDGRHCNTTLTIVDDNKLRVSPSDQVVVEGTTVHLTFTLDRPVLMPIDIVVPWRYRYEVYNDEEFVDGFLRFSRDLQEVKVTIDVIDDKVLEHDETFFVTARPPADPRGSRDAIATITITDNEALMIEFEKSTYIISKDQIELQSPTLRLYGGTAAFNIGFSLHEILGTAIGAEHNPNATLIDYEEFNKNITILKGMDGYKFLIDTIDDDIVEPPIKYFDIHIDETSLPESVSVGRINTTRIIIKDDDASYITLSYQELELTKGLYADVRVTFTLMCGDVYERKIEAGDTKLQYPEGNTFLALKKVHLYVPNSIEDRVIVREEDVHYVMIIWEP